MMAEGGETALLARAMSLLTAMAGETGQIVRARVLYLISIDPLLEEGRQTYWKSFARSVGSRRSALAVKAAIWDGVIKGNRIHFST